MSNEAIRILYSIRSYLGWELGTSEGRFASGIQLGCLRVSRSDYLVRRLPSKEVSLMSIELIPILLFAWFVELIKPIQANSGLLFLTPLLAIVWALGIIALVRRWRAE